MFFPRYSDVQLLEVYGLTGGVPKYFELIDDHAPVLKNIEQTIRERTTMLTSEIYFLLHEEFREIRVYLAILRALGKKVSTLGELSMFSGLESKVVSKYVDDLVQLKIIGRQIPAGEDCQKSRRSQYVLRDLFLNFYFHFIAPFLQDIDKARFEGVLKNLHQQFDAYMGKFVFERVCQDHLARLGDEGKLSFRPTTVGAYWDKDCQIDILGINHHDRVMIAGESKWTNKKMGLSVLKELETKVKKLSRKYDYFCHLVLFSRSGFSDDLVDTAKKQNALLVALKDISLPKTTL
ncbi:MAG TPA: DUF234 domain-containing protein [bacterium]|nr:DUF234 domain-containing protein [bacterium]